MIKRPAATVKAQTMANAVAEYDLQRIIDMGRLFASLVHEISHPLTTALIQVDQGSDRDSVSSRQVKRSLRRLKAYVEVARRQARGQSDAKNFCTHRQIDEVKRLVQPLAKQNQVQLLIDTMPHYRLTGDPIKFQQVMTNLLINAIEAYRGQSKHQPVRLIVRPGDKSITLEVVDWGEGIKAKNLERLFEPFYTTKGKSGHGLGIGLFVVKHYVSDSFNGKINVLSNPKDGTRFKVKFPAEAYPPSHLKKVA